MSNIYILIVEGNNPKDSEVFIKAAKASCAENLKNIVLKLEPLSNVTIINPANDNETKKALENMDHYNGIIFTGAHFQHMTVHARLLRCIALQPRRQRQQYVVIIFERGALFWLVSINSVIVLDGAINRCNFHHHLFLVLLLLLLLPC